MLTVFVKVFEIVGFPFGELDRKSDCQHAASKGQKRTTDLTDLDHLVGKVGELSDVDTERLIANAWQDFVQQRDVLACQRIRVRLDVRNDVEVLDVRNLLRQRSELMEMCREQDRGPGDRRKVSAGAHSANQRSRGISAARTRNAYSEMAHASPKPS